MLPIGNSIKLLSANCQGLQNTKKRSDVLSYLKEKHADIICLQDTHWVEKDYQSVKELCGHECFINGNRTNSRGVAILLKDTFEYKVIKCFKDKEGNLLQLLLKLSSMVLNLITIYAPNKDEPMFFKDINELLINTTTDYSIICGDFNLILNQGKDMQNYKHINNPNARNSVLNLISEHNLIDIYRYRNPNILRYTWRKRRPLKQARLDFFLVSSSIADIITKCDIKAGYKSDHSIIEMDISLSKFTIFKGIWKFNNSLLNNQDYLDLINKTIHEEVLKYAVPVYNMEFLENYNNYGDIKFTVDHDVFLELLLLSVRGETIKFSSYLAKQRNKTEIQLISDIENLEKMTNVNNNLNHDLLSDKKVELEKLREYRLKGEQVRSRTQWLQHGEKPSKFFCSLENRNFTDKTFRNILLEDGTILSEQGPILEHVKNYYQNLFKNRDAKLDPIDLNNTFPNFISQRVTDPQIGDKILISELSDILKNMKHNKTPGIDGITTEFLKVFWGKFKYFVANAANDSFSKGCLSTSLRQCVITCLPKGNKDKRLVKNWCPISLLSVVYKLISGVIAKRLKSTLCRIISNSQSGFIPGRQLSDNTRFIYDLIHTADISNIDGLLMLIDFEKAFDSMSWKFIYNVLDFFGFNEKFINWIKLFNTDITAYIVQCGQLSDKIFIGRGCRQGDPISAYLFLLAAEILAMLVKSNQDIKGITINKKEFKISQFADDTTLTLDGSQVSLQAALNTLETYGTYSGLKMNKEKTKLIWLGRKKFSKEKLNVSVNLDWGCTEFTLLGIQFSTDMRKILDLNFTRALAKIKNEIKKWKSKRLTPIGKITLIKTNILSKAIHLLTVLPAPPEFLKTVNDLLFSFLWDHKPDKIKRTITYKEYLNGGLKMIDIYKFEKSLKINWLKRKFLQPTTQWNTLFHEVYGDIDKLYKLGGEWPTSKKIAYDNKFWKSVFESWAIYCENKTPSNNFEILQSCIWYNRHLSKETLFLSKMV